MCMTRASVVMSVLNGQHHLRGAVDSILGQTFTDFELIIIDDGSTDTTWEILLGYDDPRLRLLRNEVNLGLTRSLNKGLALATGEYVARQDADDISLPERLAKQVAYLDGHTEVGLLGTAFHVLDDHGQYTATRRQPAHDTEIRWRMLFANAFCHTSVMFRRVLVEPDKPFYNESMRYSQDYERWGRLLGQTRSANLVEPLVGWRERAGSITSTHRVEQEQAANYVSADGISKLLPNKHLSVDEIATLRQWYHGFREGLTGEDVGLCLVLLEILDAFSAQPDVDVRIARSINRTWV